MVVEVGNPLAGCEVGELLSCVSGPVIGGCDCLTDGDFVGAIDSGTVA